LYAVLYRERIVTHSRGWRRLWVQVLVGNVAMTAVLVAMYRPLAWWLEAELAVRASWLGACVAAGAGTYFAALFLLGLRPSRLGLAG
jgi:putative peptidoglycan lipid II flippase